MAREGGQEETVILWTAKCLASSAKCSLLFGVTELEEQNKAVKVQNKYFQAVHLEKAVTCASAHGTHYDPPSPEAISTRCFKKKKEQETSLTRGGVMQPSAMSRLGTVTKLGAEGALCLDCRGLADAGTRQSSAPR